MSSSPPWNKRQRDSSANDDLSSETGQGPRRIAGRAPGSSSPVLPYDTDLPQPETEDIPVDELEVEDAGFEEDEEGENLFGDNMFDDYEANAELDRYEGTDLNDAEDFEAMGPEARRMAEAYLDRRDRREARARGERVRPRFDISGFQHTGRGRAPELLSDGEEDSEDEEGLLNRNRPRHIYDEARRVDEETGRIPYEGLMPPPEIALGIWLQEPKVRASVLQELKQYLVTSVDAGGHSMYRAKIQQLGEQNKESLEVSYGHLLRHRATLAYFLINAPAAMLPLFDEVAMDAVLLVFEDYRKVTSEIHVRIVDLALVTKLCELRQVHLNSLVSVHGVVTRRSNVLPELKYVKFDCRTCGATLGPFFQDGDAPLSISFCSSCQSRGPFAVNVEQTMYRNFQRVTLQESPGSVEAGRVPHQREVVLTADLINCCKPGDEIEVVGIYKNNYDVSLNVRHGFPVFSTVIEANSVRSRAEIASLALTPQDTEEVRRLAQDRGHDIRSRIVKSIAPSVYGHKDVKTAIALALFGGVAVEYADRRRRGDINVLLLGDPGTAKSQMLKYVESVAPRSVLATGQGASAVGLTASVHRDPVSREWTLEGGALVLADHGVCLIDEFDKMNDQDRTSIHEAMEQQTISVSKAGIVTTLSARCSVIAAANPIRGNYNPQYSLAYNVNLTEPILSRFDITCVVRDECDPVVDEMLAKFVVASHLRSHPDFDRAADETSTAAPLDEEIIPQELLKKYIHMAKGIEPQWNGTGGGDFIEKLYADLRSQAHHLGSVTYSIRNLEGIVRMAEASARMRLSSVVQMTDVEYAASVAIHSFVSSQKRSAQAYLERAFRQYVRYAADDYDILAFVLGSIVKERVRIAHVTGQDVSRVSVPRGVFEAQARDVADVSEFLSFYQSSIFRNNGYVLAGEDAIVKDFTGDYAGPLAPDVPHAVRV